MITATATRDILSPEIMISLRFDPSTYDPDEIVVTHAGRRHVVPTHTPYYLCLSASPADEITVTSRSRSHRVAVADLPATLEVSP